MRELLPSRSAGAFLTGVFGVLCMALAFLLPVTVSAAPRFVASFASTNQVKGLGNPIQIAVTDSQLFILDDGVIDVRDRSYPYSRAAKYGVSGTNEGFSFRSPRGIALNVSGDRLAVADTGNNRIQLFSVNGSALAFQKSFGYASPTNDPLRDGTFNAPNAVAFTPAGDLLVADTGNRRVQRFDSEGAHLATYPIVDGNASLVGICVDEGDTGYWVAVKGGGNRVARYDYGATSPTSVFSTRFGTFSDVKALPGGYLAVSDATGMKAMILDQSDAANPVACEVGARNSPGGKDAWLGNPAGVFPKADEKLVFVADPGNKRVVWYGLAGYEPPVDPPAVEPPDTIYPDPSVTTPIGCAPAVSSTNHLESSRENICAAGSQVVDVAASKDYLYALVRHGLSGGEIVSDHVSVLARKSSGTPLVAYHEFTDGSGKAVRLSSPTSIALNPAGNLLAIADTFHDRILLFSVAGQELTFRQAISNVVLFAASADDEKSISPSLCRPRSVSFSAQDDILVADSGNMRVVRIRAGGYASADSYRVGKDGKASVESATFDTFGGQDGFWVVDSQKSAPPYVAFQPYGSARPSYVVSGAFEHPVELKTWKDGDTDRIAVLDKSYSAVLVFQPLPEIPAFRLTSLAGSRFSTNSFSGPTASSAVLWRNESFWSKVEENGTAYYVPDPIMEDVSVPKLQNPGGLDVYSENGTNVLYVADTGNSRIAWYGLTIEGKESAGEGPVPPVPGEDTPWPFTAISVEGAAPGQVVLRWAFPADISSRNGYYRIDHAKEPNGPWEPITSVVIENPLPAGRPLPVSEDRLDRSHPKLDPERNFFTLWWVDGLPPQP